MALAYHGHQFRSYNPDIGDGRGFLFAQLRDQRGRLMDLGTKGSGTTPYSRTADGRLTLKGAMREALATEMLEALGVPTSRTFSVIETGEHLLRHDEPSPTRSAVLLRLNHSHIRFGTFQRLAYFGDTEGLRVLLAYAVRHYFPDLGEDDAAGFLSTVSQRVANATAALMAAGFVHGVLNTDNMNITGEVFDFGPWKFAPVVEPGFTAASFDHSGLYAYGRQPEAVYWNLAALADALRLISDETSLSEALEVYPEAYGQAFASAMLKRLGLKTREAETDQKFASDLFTFMHRTRIPFERAMFDLFGGQARREKREQSPHADLYRNEDIIGRLDAYEPDGLKRLSDGAFTAEPPTLLIPDVETLWQAIDQTDDWAPFHAKIDAIRRYGAALGLATTL